jgi:hypothetical protein
LREENTGKGLGDGFRSTVGKVDDPHRTADARPVVAVAKDLFKHAQVHKPAPKR